MTDPIDDTQDVLDPEDLDGALVDEVEPAEADPDAGAEEGHVEEPEPADIEGTEG